MIKYRRNMDNTSRAKQFAPFAALKGHEMELAKQFEPFDEKILLAEDEIRHINSVLIALDKGDEVKITYYNNKVYTTIFGVVEKIYNYEMAMLIKGQKISFKDIYRIEKIGL